MLTVYVDISAKLQYKSSVTICSWDICTRPYATLMQIITDLCTYRHVIIQHNGAQTKWPPFSRWHFQMNIRNENAWISNQISLNLVPRDPINTIPPLVQIMAWCRPGDKPLSEPMMCSLLTHIWANRHRRVDNINHPFYEYHIVIYGSKSVYPALYNLHHFTLYLSWPSEEL